MPPLGEGRGPCLAHPPQKGNLQTLSFTGSGGGFAISAYLTFLQGRFILCRRALLLSLSAAILQHCNVLSTIPCWRGDNYLYILIPSLSSSWLATIAALVLY